MKLKILFLTMVFLLVPPCTQAKAKKINDHHWTGVERVVAIGDLHGDYGQYINVMRSAGLVDHKQRWGGGKTHLVQTGDITDRGADSRKIIDHLLQLKKQAKKKGGYIHLLIGNHETMNVIGDLRYVSKGEFDAFRTKNSARYQELQWQHQLEWMESRDAEAFATLDQDTYRKEWEQRVPLGWVEHRQAWALNGEYGGWVSDNQVAIRVNDSIFLHGGISSKYCKFSLEEMTGQVMKAMKNYNPAVTTIIDDPLGPVWYRGLAQESEDDEIYIQTLDNILNRYGIKHMVVGHSPTGGVVWPRFDQRVVVNDTGIAAHYGSHKGVLEITAGGLVAIYGDQRIPLHSDNEGREAYLRAVIEADSNNGQLKARLARMLAPPPAEPEAEAPSDPAGTETGLAEVIPGTCR